MALKHPSKIGKITKVQPSAKLPRFNCYTKIKLLQGFRRLQSNGDIRWQPHVPWQAFIWLGMSLYSSTLYMDNPSICTSLCIQWWTTKPSVSRAMSRLQLRVFLQLVPLLHQHELLLPKTPQWFNVKVMVFYRHKQMDLMPAMDVGPFDFAKILRIGQHLSVDSTCDRPKYADFESPKIQRMPGSTSPAFLWVRTSGQLRVYKPNWKSAILQ